MFFSLFGGDKVHLDCVLFCCFFFFFFSFFLSFFGFCLCWMEKMFTWIVRMWWGGGGRLGRDNVLLDCLCVLGEGLLGGDNVHSSSGHVSMCGGGGEDCWVETMFTWIVSVCTCGGGGGCLVQTWLTWSHLLYSQWGYLVETEHCC